MLVIVFVSTPVRMSTLCMSMLTFDSFSLGNQGPNMLTRLHHLMHCSSLSETLSKGLCHVTISSIHQCTGMLRPAFNLLRNWLPCMQVQDEAIKSLTICNTGKYAVNFCFTVDSERIKSLFTIEPSTGIVAPGASLGANVIFNREKTLKKELSLKGKSRISLTIIEPLTDKKESVIPIMVSTSLDYS